MGITNMTVTRSALLLALLGSCVLYNPCFGVLLDHGPSDPNLIWPQWYRENTVDKIALGLCTSTATSGTGPLCFPLDRSPVPPSFAGNVGEEIFYFNMQTNINSGDIDLRYITALEAAYGTLDPVGAAIKGNEIVFSRVRFVMSIATAAATRCAGDYTIIHPYGSQTFTGVSGDKRALVVTFDKPLGVIGDFDGVLTDGDIGPFLKWDTDFPVVSGNDRFIGDPNVPHTYTGSPFNQNFVFIQGPPGCNVDGLGNNAANSTTGLLLGQIWTAPIPTPTTIVSAVYSRKANDNNVVDVEAKAAPGNKLVLAGAAPFPATLMVEDKDASGAGTGKFHAHVEYTGELSTSIRVVNLASNPIISAEAGLADIVEIGKAEYNPTTKTICVDAKTSHEDSTNPASLFLQQAFQGQLSTTSTSCTPAAGFSCVCVPLPNGGPQVTSQSTPITVVSTKGGKATANVKYLTGSPDNEPVPAGFEAVADSFNVSSGAPTTIDVGANDQFDRNAAGATFVIIQQPSSGTVSIGSPLGNVVYTPPASVQPGTFSFSYIIQLAGDVYSNIATVSITLQDTVLPPTANPDAFAVRASTTKTLDILLNDSPVRGTTIDKTSINVNTAGTRGQVNVNPSAGTITYIAPTAAGVDFFTYTVASSPAASGGASAPARVSISVPAAAESIIITRARARANGRWVIIGSSNTAGWVGSITGTGGTVDLRTSFSCYMRSGTNWLFIGRVDFLTNVNPPTATIDVTAGSLVTLPNGTDGIVPRCGTSKGNTCVIQCATNNVVSPYPSANGGTPSDRPTTTIVVD